MWKRLFLVLSLLMIIVIIVVIINFNNNLVNFKAEIIDELKLGEFNLLEKQVIKVSWTSSDITYRIFIDKPQDEDMLKNIARKCILESLNEVSVFNKIDHIGIEFVISSSIGNQTYRYYYWTYEKREKAFSYKDYILLDVVTSNRVDL